MAMPTDAETPKIGHSVYRHNTQNGTSGDPKQPELWQRCNESALPDGTSGSFGQDPRAICGDLVFNNNRRTIDVYSGPDIDPNTMALRKGVWVPPSLCLGGRYGYVERFLTKPVLAPSGEGFTLSGTNAADVGVALRTNGGVTLTTAGANNDQMIVGVSTPLATVQFLSEKRVVWESIIETAANIDNITIWGGLKLTSTGVVATDNDQAFFRVARAAATAYFKPTYSIGGVDVEVDPAASGTAAAITAACLLVASTHYHLRIEICMDRIARFYINGVLVASSTALANAINLKAFVGVQATAAAAKAIGLLGEAANRVY